MIRINKYKTAASLAIVAAMTLVIPSYAKHAGTVQPFVCGTSTAEVVEEKRHHLAIVRSKAVKVNHTDGNCGYVVFDFGECTLIDNDLLTDPDTGNCQAMRIAFSDDLGIAKEIIVRMTFRPEASSGLVTIDKPLSEFKIRKVNGVYLAYAGRKDIWNNRPGAPSLRKIAVISTKPGAVLLGNIAWTKDGRYVEVYEPAKVVLEQATCEKTQN